MINQPAAQADGQVWGMSDFIFDIDVLKIMFEHHSTKPFDIQKQVRAAIGAALTCFI
jgi:hypothetical protein